ncbi:MAG: hypothetical protein ACKO7X_06300, partial [Bacteroidota bacterium]
SGVMFNVRFVVLATGSSSVRWDLGTAGNWEYAEEFADIITNCNFVDGGITCESALPVCDITLSSPTGTSSQTVTVNTAITNITYTTTGATGVTVSGLPSGVTGTWVSGLLTISGTPTSSGIFNYNVSITGGCTGGTNIASGSITVQSGSGGGNFNIQTTLGSYSSTTCAVGDTIVLPITVAMASGISTGAISMAIDYDTTHLRCISGVTGLNANIATGFLSNCGLVSGLQVNGPYTASTRRQFRAAWFNLVPVSFSGVMFNVRFVVLATGSSSVKWDLGTAGNCEYADELAEVIANTEWVNGSITTGLAACPSTAGILSGKQVICVNRATVFSSTVLGGIWSSSMTGVATVNPTTGLVMGIAQGSASIIYTITGCPNLAISREVTIIPCIPFPTYLCLPNITTISPMSFGIDSVVSGGNISNDGGSSIIMRGVCYSTSPNPNISHARTEDGSGIGLFSSVLRNLNPSTTYYVRSYAKNSDGIVTYGNEEIFFTNASSNR